MAFMVIDRDSLITDMRAAVIEVVFVTDEENRPVLINCTLQSSYLPRKILNEELKRNNDYMPVWDTDYHCWRILPLRKILTCQTTNR